MNKHTAQPDAIKNDWRPGFLTALETAGNVTQACRLCGIGRSTVYDARKADAAFAAAWDDALESATDALEAEARRRAVDGVTEPTRHGLVTRYSDTLLIFLLKGLRPEKYRDSYRPPMPPSPVDLDADIEAMSADERELYGLKLNQYIAKLRSMGYTQ